ncbi:TatD family hydrolase [Candidatus Kaiserbacteria bacterium]|nr:TatD family hydrolase [Candidatus Kaiserbacteria bacterium]
MRNFEYVDVHTHVNLAAFKDDQDAVTRRALSAGVTHINVGTQRDTSQAAVALAEKYEEGVYAAIGLHPVHTSKSFHDVQELDSEPTADTKGFNSRGEVFDQDFYKKLAGHPKVVAIGECGLDYYRLEENTSAVQKEAFVSQIELANEVGKPLMLHIRSGSGANAYRDAYELLKAHAKVLGNVHFFAGSIEDAKRFLDMGYTVSFTGVITFTHDYDEVVAYAPLDMLHAETDAPYVTPVPLRGERNEPFNVQEVVKKIAEIKKMDFERVRTQLRKNAKRIFSI